MSAQAEGALVSGRCSICWDGPAKVAYIGCGHVALCKRCHELGTVSISRCPLCRRQSQRLLLFVAGMPDETQVRVALEEAGADFTTLGGAEVINQPGVEGDSDWERTEAPQTARAEAPQPPPVPNSPPASNTSRQRPQASPQPQEAQPPPSTEPQQPHEPEPPFQHPLPRPTLTFHEAVAQFQSVALTERQRFYAVWRSNRDSRIVGIHAGAGRAGYDAIISINQGFGGGLGWRSEDTLEAALRKYNAEKDRARAPTNPPFFGWVGHAPAIRGLPWEPRLV